MFLVSIGLALNTLDYNNAMFEIPNPFNCVTRQTATSTMHSVKGRYLIIPFSTSDYILRVSPLVIMQCFNI